MEPFNFICRATKFKHSCKYRDADEPEHPDEFNLIIEELINFVGDLNYRGVIKSKANNYQIDIDSLDHNLVSKLAQNFHWQKQPLSLEIQEMQIIPDGVFTNGRRTIAIEIEKSNKKTIWFDLIKLMMLVGSKKINYGLLFVPRNYAHKIGIWNLFDDAQNYRRCLVEYAGVSKSLISNLAIIGYDNEIIDMNANWHILKSEDVVKCKELAEFVFSQQ